MENPYFCPHTLSLRAAFISLACVALMVSCGEALREPTTSERLAAAKTRQETVPDYYRPRKSVDYMGDLRGIELERNVGKTLLEKAVKAKQEIVRAAAAPVAKPSSGVQPLTAALLAETPTGQIPSPPIPLTNSSRNPSGNNGSSLQAAPANSGEPKEIAATPPTAVTASESRSNPVTPIVAISRIEPKFPTDATLQGVSAGVVRVRLAIDAAGAVTNVAILSAEPARIFDRETKSALGRWKFNSGADGRIAETEIKFQR